MFSVTYNYTNMQVVANKKSSPFAFQPRALTIQELKKGFQKKSVNGVQKVQDNKVDDFLKVEIS